MSSQPNGKVLALMVCGGQMVPVHTITQRSGIFSEKLQALALDGAIPALDELPEVEVTDGHEGHLSETQIHMDFVFYNICVLVFFSYNRSVDRVEFAHIVRERLQEPANDIARQIFARGRTSPEGSAASTRPRPTHTSEGLRLQ